MSNWRTAQVEASGELDLIADKVREEVAPQPLSFNVFSETPRYKAIINPNYTLLEKERLREAQLAREARQNRPDTASSRASLPISPRGFGFAPPLTARAPVSPGRPKPDALSPSNTARSSRPRTSRSGGGELTLSLPLTSLVPHHPGEAQTARPHTTGELPSPAQRWRRARRRKQPPINRPHRVFPPPFMNVPKRLDFQAESMEAGSSDQQKAVADVERKTNRELIKDYALRAKACERAGRRRAEANSHYCMGVIYDNMGAYQKAIECYHKFRDVLKLANDKFAEGLAHNSIGVSYQNMGPKYFPNALYHHAKHRDIADIAGRFIAHTNLGLIFNSLGNAEQAALNHQHALRCAIRLSSVAGQSIAIGNLGLTGYAHKDYVTAKACMERHLQLSRTLQDPRGQSNAFQTLGEIATQQGDFEEASSFFSQAMRFSRSAGDFSTATRARVNLGVARGTQSMDERLRQVAASLNATIGADPGLLRDETKELDFDAAIDS